MEPIFFKKNCDVINRTHGLGDVVLESAEDPVYPETPEEQQFADGGQLTVRLQGERHLLWRLQLVPLAKKGEKSVKMRAFAIH